MTPRKPLTRQQFGFLIIKQDCLCGCGCKRRLDFSAPKLVTDEHVTPIFSTPEGVDPNRIENRALWLTECSKPKTAKEAPDRAKVRRIEGKKTQADKRAARKASGTHRPIAGPGFQSGYTKKMSGQVVRRGDNNG
jgi:hypothetical protein